MSLEKYNRLSQNVGKANDALNKFRREWGASFWTLGDKIEIPTKFGQMHGGKVGLIVDVWARPGFHDGTIEAVAAVKVLRRDGTISARDRTTVSKTIAAEPAQQQEGAQGG